MSKSAHNSATSRRLAVAHAFMGVTYVAEAQPEGPPLIIRLKTDDNKNEFLFTQVREGDQILIELGGAGDKLALIMKLRGADVQRIATWKLGNKDRTRQTVTNAGWTLEDEPSIGEETSDKLTARKARALALLVTFHHDPSEFIAVDEQDTDILFIKADYRAYRAAQKSLLGIYQRLFGTYNDQYLLELARDRTVTIMSGSKVATVPALRAINALATVIPENQRDQFLAKLGIDDLRAKKMIPRKAVREMLRRIIDALMESDVISPFLASMKETKKQIEKRLKQHPVFVQVFSKIPGCGPLIAARMIAAIVDIRRFKGVASLVAYAGYHLFKDGTRARRRTGHASNWNMELKQAVYLWCQQTLKMPKSPWRARLDRRRAYELTKILRERQQTADEQGLAYEILPVAFKDRVITSTRDVTLADLSLLAAHVDVLRKQAGVTAPAKDEDEDVDNEAGDKSTEEAEPGVKDAKLAKLVRGVKMQALQKAMRWLGQQILKHVFKEWRKALGLTDLPLRDPANQPKDPEHGRRLGIKWGLIRKIQWATSAVQSDPAFSREEAERTVEEAQVAFFARGADELPKNSFFRLLNHDFNPAYNGFYAAIGQPVPKIDKEAATV